MADISNSVILKVSFDGNNAIQSTVALKNELASLKEQQKKLTEAVAEGGAGSKKAAVELEVLNAKIKDNQRETRTVTKFIDDSIKARKAESGSIADNRARLSTLTAEYIKMKNPTKEASNQIKALSDRLKEQEGAIGDNRRNVGDYKGALASLKGPLGNAVNGISAFNTTMRANPIGAVVTVLQFLYEKLSSNAEIADKISFVFAGVNKAFKFVVDTVKNVVTNFDNLTSAIKNPILFFSNFTKGMKDAAVAGYDAAKQLDAFTESQANIDAQISQTEISVRSLTESLKDRTKTEKERISIANEIARLEVEAFDLQVKKSKELLDAKKLELSNQELRGEQKAELIRLESDVALAESEKQIAQSKKQTRINILLDKEEKSALSDTSELETAEKKRERLLDERLKKEKETYDKIVKLNKDEVISLLKEIEKKSKALFNDFKSQDELLNKANEAQAKAQDYLLNNQLDSFNKRIEIANQEQQKQIDNTNLYYDALILANQGNIELQIKLEKERQAQLNGITETGAATRTQIKALEFQLELSFIEQGLNALSSQFSKSAKSQKAFAIAQVAIDEARSISSLITSSTANPLNSATFGAAGAIQFAAGLATLIANITKVTAIINSTPDSFYEGGYTGDGNPTSESTALGVKPYTYHKGEYVVPNKVLRSEQGSMFVGALEAMRKSTPSVYGNIRGFADGGFTSRASLSSVNSRVSNDELISAFSNMPIPVVRVSDINKVNGQLNRTINVSSL